MDDTVWTHSRILDRFSIFCGATEGIDRWLSPATPDWVLDTLSEIATAPITRTHLNQLLTVVNQEVSEPFFRYYWLEAPDQHPYDVRRIAIFRDEWVNGNRHIASLEQLYWGLYRFYVDALLFFGNINMAFTKLNGSQTQPLGTYFEQYRINTDELLSRRDLIRPKVIPRDDRYLISEMACKSFLATDVPEGELAQVLLDLYERYIEAEGGKVTPRQLLIGAYKKGDYEDRQLQFDLSADDILDDVIQNIDDLSERIQAIARKFETTRRIALANTGKYLSMVDDLDVYVATSMRTRNDFRRMADFCDNVFHHKDLKSLRFRYFDPTLSAAAHHEDKGLIECLMVKCSKVLILHAGKKDSFGKDAEAAMALNLGKPVIIFADEEYRSRFFRDIHPLARLIDISNGVANGAMVATDEDQVVELLRRIFYNDLRYEIYQRYPEYLTLREILTGSVVRLQTNHSILHETFWKHYNPSIDR